MTVVNKTVLNTGNRLRVEFRCTHRTHASKQKQKKKQENKTKQNNYVNYVNYLDYHNHFTTCMCIKSCYTP